MNETPLPPTLPVPKKDPNDHSMAVIIATTVVALTCILSCAAVLIFLILQINFH